MKIIVPVVLLVWASVCAGAEWDAFKVAVGKAELDGKSYYDMPWTVKQAVDGGKWVKIDEDRTLSVDVYSQPEDPRVLLLFDKKGNIAGMRMAIIKEDAKKKALDGGHTFELDYDHNPMYEKGNFFGKDLWFTSVLFASPKTLSAGGRNFLNKATDDVIESVWFKPKGKWVEVSKDECAVSDEFEGRDCLAKIGKHYFYKNIDEDCKKHEPFAVFYDKGRLSGVALIAFGSTFNHPGAKFHFEDLNPPQKLKETKPLGPQCITEYITKYGLTVMRVFLKKNADIKCSDQEWRTVHCKN